MFTDHLRDAISRHRSHRHHSGGSPTGSHWGRGFMGGGDLPSARKLTAAELQLVLLALLAERPAHGYEIIRLLQERSAGFYEPSPGMIYPALTYLEEIGHAAMSQDGTRKLYTLTDAGRAHLDANRDQATQILETLARIGARMAQVREAYAGIGDLDPQAADELSQARHALKTALMADRGSTPEQARRITRILNQATADILATRKGPSQ